MAHTPVSSTGIATLPANDPRGDFGLTADSRRAERMRMLRAIFLSYCIDGVLLFLLHLSGAVSLEAVLLGTLGGTAWCGVIFAIYRCGWNARFRDPYFTLPLTLGSALLQFVIAWRAPESALLVLMIVFIIFAFAALRLRLVQLVMVWILCSAGIIGVVVALHGDLSLPHATPWQTGLSSLWISLVLGRCAFVGLYGAGVRKQLSKRNRQLADAKDRLHELATRDSLTGALNRRAIMDLLETSLAGGERPAAVLMDLDHFKQINDQYGHLVGDTVLRRFVTTAAHALRTNDRLARYGGEEFLLVIAAPVDERTALAIAERVREVIAEDGWDDVAAGLHVTVSMGVACAHEGEDVEDLLRRADDALYLAKGAGRNRVRSG